MTKQQKTYLLLSAVALVWGLIGFRIYKSLQPSQKIVSETLPKNTFTPKKVEERKAYTVKANYRDPFLGKIKTTEKKVKRRKTVVKQPTRPFPSIIYNGVIEGGRSKSYTITINGKQELVKLGEKINEITLIKGTSNKIVVRFQGATKTIQLQ